MAKDTPTFQHSTWRKIHLLSSKGDDLDKEYANILATLIEYRLYSGITQSDLSKKSGLSVSMISKIESQNSIPNFKTLLKYLKGLNLSLEFIKIKWVDLSARFFIKKSKKKLLFLWVFLA